jgi:uncharacterized membrane protein YsdA (DUF1294 family)
MELNLITFGYLFFRLAPFVLVCFFTLASVFNQDFKGLVYLVGLIFACFSTMMIGNALPLQPPQGTNELCNLITIGSSPGYSKLSLGQTIFGYTFAYLMYIIVKHKLVKQNLPTVIFFPIIIVVDILWNMNNNCYSFIQLLISLMIGGIIGASWGRVIEKTKMTQLQYFNQISGKQACTRPSKSTFKCNVYKNGQLISGKI